MQAHYARFQSARVIAVARVLLANFFLIAVVAFETKGQDDVVLLLSTYVLWSAVLFLGISKSWWADRRTGGLAHAVDVVMFGALIYSTEGYASPFLTFSVFLVLSSLARWGWRSASVTAILVATLFLVIGVSLSSAGSEPMELQPFVLLAGANLIVLCAIIIWFGAHERHFQVKELIEHLEPHEFHEQAPLPRADTILKITSEAFGSDHVVLAWSEREEPWLNVSSLRDGQVETRRLAPLYGPIVSLDLVSAGVFLFDLRKQRLLMDKEGLHALAHGSAISQRFAADWNISEGIRLPIRADGYDGEVFVMKTSSLASDDIYRGAQFSSVISELFHRSALLAKTEEAAIHRERLAVAQDLHDSVIQFLAGMSMKLEGTRKAATRGKSIDQDISVIQEELKREQRDLRNFIITLRGAGGPPKRTDIAKGLGYLTGRLSSQWGIDCRLEYEAPVMGSTDVQQDLENLVRETVSNAVRHGRASKLLARVSEENHRIRLEIQDNGTGFPDKGDFRDEELRQRMIGPWSLHERVRKRGGELHLSSTNDGSKLDMYLPVEG